MTATSKVIIVSDLHLRDNAAFALDIDTTGALRTAVAQINDWHGDAAHVVFLGDLTDEANAQTYARFADIANTLTMPWACTLGNHDDVAAAGTIATPHPETGRFDSDIAVAGGRVIVLDTSVAGAPHGALTDRQLAWLAQRDLSGPTLIGLHHPPQNLGIWTDRIKLHDTEKLLQVLQDAGGPVQILAGHVHMTSSGSWSGIPCATMAGGHFRVLPVLDTVPRKTGLMRNFATGPLEYTIALIGPSGVQLHFESYGPRPRPFTRQQIEMLMG